MKQKFGKLTFVNVTKDMPFYMKHFDCGFKGIVDGTYSQIYGGRNINSYAIYKLEDGKVVNRISWYEENQLEFDEGQNRDLAENLIEEYNLRRKDSV
jgi:hypothetical protein